MQDNRPDLALSRTFRLVGGELSAADQAEQWAQVLNLPGFNQVIGSGEIVDSKYRVLALVGKGGMGSVYRVQHLLLGKEMALKTFNAADMTADAWQRFQREAIAIAKLTHANIVQVFDFGIGADNVPYYTMELLSGQSLSQRICGSGPLELAEAMPVFIAAADALSHAHKLKIVHRDIKPANIFLSRTAGGKSVVKVVDFGIAKLATVQSYDEQTQTDSGVVFGSPLYMSPEQSLGELTDHRTDIYSFGCTVFETLTGKPPFLGANAFETISMHHHKKPPHMVNVCEGMRVSQAMERLVGRLLEKDVKKRYQSFDQVVQDLSNIPPGDLVPDGRKISVPVGGGKTRQLLEDTDEQSQSQENTLGNTGPIAAANRRLIYFGLSALALIVVAVAATGFVVISSHQANSGRAHRAGTGSVESRAARASILLPNGKPDYFAQIKPDGTRVFYFPTDIMLGSVVVPPARERLANTIITVRPGQQIQFRPGDDICANPELFRRFHKDDITFLDCSNVLQLSAPGSDLGKASWGSHQLDIATQAMPGITDLDVTGAYIGGESVDYINRLYKVNSLIVNDTKVTGPDLVRLKCLHTCKRFEWNHISDVMVAVKKLIGSQALQTIKLEECSLKDDDMKTIARLKGLWGLSVQHNPITARGLMDLAPLTDLECLEVAGTPVGAEAVPLLSSFKKLRSLSVTPDNWTNDQLVKLRRAMPDCSITYKGKSGEYNRYGVGTFK